MLRLILPLLLLLVPHSVFAEWRVDTRLDAMTDEVKKSAVVTNEAGHSFSIYRISENGPVWGNFSLSERSMDQVGHKIPPVYRIDKNPPHDLANNVTLHNLIGSAYEWQPKWVNFLIWEGNEDEGIANSLLQLMDGQSVLFRYHLSTGGYKDTVFSLNNAKQAIVAAIGIDPDPDMDKQARIREFKQAVINETRKCSPGSPNFRACFSKVSECRKQSDNDLITFDSCMK